MPPKRKAAAKTESEPVPEQSKDVKRAILEFLLNEAANEFSDLQGKEYDPKEDAKRMPNLFDHMHMSVAKEYTPFMNLVTSCVMSKPISSRLGVRTLLTAFHANFGFSTPASLKNASTEQIYEMLSAARTQHKDKTAAQLQGIATKVVEEYAADENDTSLDKMHEVIKGNPAELDKILQSFKGIGPTGTEIFKRRMQVSWSEIYPFADERCLHAASHLGLIDGEEVPELAEAVKKALPCETEDEERKQFAAVVDSLVAADLENKLDEIVGRFTENVEAKDDGPPKKQAKKKK